MLIVILCGIGTVMLYSASSFKSLYQTSGLTDTIYLQSHLKKMMIGFFGMFLFTVMDYRKLKIAAPYILILSIILLVLTKLIYIIKQILKKSKEFIKFKFTFKLIFSSNKLA